MAFSLKKLCGTAEMRKLGIVEATIKSPNGLCAYLYPGGSMAVRWIDPDITQTGSYPGNAFKTAAEFLTGTGSWKPSGLPTLRVMSQVKPKGPPAGSSPKTFKTELLKRLVSAVDDAVLEWQHTQHGLWLFPAGGDPLWEAYIGEIDAVKYYAHLKGHDKL